MAILPWTLICLVGLVNRSWGYATKSGRLPYCDEVTSPLPWKYLPTYEDNGQENSF